MIKETSIDCNINNSGSEKVRSRIISNSPKGLFGINIGPNKDTNNRLEDYLICFRKFYNLADYLTINISSPNTENLRNFHNEDELNELLSSINNEKKILKTTVPITVKISPDIELTQEIDIGGETVKVNIPMTVGFFWPEA